MNEKRNIPVKILRGEEAREFFKKIPLDSEKPKEPKDFRFQLSDSQSKKYKSWSRTHNCSVRNPQGIRYVGAIGGADTFHITGTGLGYIVNVECTCGSICDLTEDF